MKLRNLQNGQYSRPLLTRWNQSPESQRLKTLKSHPRPKQKPPEEQKDRTSVDHSRTESEERPSSAEEHEAPELESWELKPIESKEDLDDMLDRHPHVRDMRRFDVMYHRAEVYHHVMELKESDDLPEKKIRDWAQELDVSYGALQSYLAETKRPELHEVLERAEEARLQHESKLSEEAFENRIDSSKVYESLKQFREVEDPTPEDLAKALEDLQRNSGLDSRVQWAEMRPYHGRESRWLWELAKPIEQNREEIEKELNTRLGLDEDPNRRMRFGVVDDRLYFREQDTSERNWMNMYKDEAFYFKTVEQKQKIMDETTDRLGVQSGRRLSELIGQLTDHERTATCSNPNYDLKRDHRHLRGEGLGLMLDATGRRIQDIQSEIERMGAERRGMGAIRNPRFPEDPKEIDLMFASMFGAGLSDGHLEKSSRGFVYTESNKDRVEILNSQVMRFGDVYHGEETLPNGVTRVRYASALGRLLEQRGMPVGDKAIHNEGLPDWIQQGSNEVKINYLGAMWAEDGNFYVDPDGRSRFQWDRGTSLIDQSKDSDYGLESRITPEHVDLVEHFGKKKDGPRFGKRFELTKGMLDALEKSSDPAIAAAASDLSGIVNDNKSRLMKDEMSLLVDLGMEVDDYLRYVTYYEKSGRLSSLWHGTICRVDDVMRTGLLCPPEDVEKRSKFEAWANTQLERRNQVLEVLESEGFDMEGRI
ncbi:MAG: hypothetical protein ACXAEN_23040 [Candidatus Thorarchaeota archaeon]